MSRDTLGTMIALAAGALLLVGMTGKQPDTCPDGKCPLPAPKQPEPAPQPKKPAPQP